MSTGLQPGWPVVSPAELKRSAGWFLGVGIALAIFGVIAISVAGLATLVSVELFGWLLLLGGIVSAAHAFWRRQWSGFFIELFTGILYIIVGLMMIANPAESALALTLLIALFLMIGGVLRIVSALMIPFHHSAWVLLNGIIALLLGVMIWRQWPFSGLWVIGLFIGVDLLFYGLSMVMLGLTVKKLPDAPA